MKKITKVKQIKELANQGFNIPNVNSKEDLGTKEHRVRILKYVRENDYIITPIGWQTYIDSVSKFECCPCDNDRKLCPCLEAENEIKDNGHCLCGLIWRSYATYQAKNFKE